MSVPIPEDILALVKERNEITDRIAALNSVKKNLDDRIMKLSAESFGDYLSFRYGDTVVRVKPSYQ